MVFLKTLFVASLALTANMLPTATARSQKRSRDGRKSNRSIFAKEMMEAKKNGASKQDLKKLHQKLQSEARVAKAAGLTMETLKKAQSRGASIDDIKAKVNMHNLEKRKRPRGFLKKKETSITDILFPGISPIEYRNGEPMVTVAELVSSARTQLPFAYYKLPVCEPTQTKIKGRKRQNLGERLMGKAVAMQSPYMISVLQDQTCESLCTLHLDRKRINQMRKLILRDYTANISIDGLPVNVPKKNGVVIRGYPLGSKLINEATEKTDFVLHNHLSFVIEYNVDEASAGHVRIVGFTAKPVSIDHNPADVKATCNAEHRPRNTESTLLHLQNPIKSKTQPVTYSYDVKWIETEKPWTDRWDVFLVGAPDDSTAHNMSLLNTIMIVIFLCTCTAFIMIKALRKDLALYNGLELGIDDNGEEESGWKMIHGDIFRPPSYSPMGLSVLVGTGSQIACSLLGTLLMSQTNLLTPTMKGQALQNVVLLYVFSGSVSGYISSRIFKFFGGKNWKLNTLLTASLFPGAMMVLFLMLNVFLALYGSAKTVSFFTIIVSFFLCVGVSAPLIFVGSFIGFKRDLISVPTRTNQIARVVPPQMGIIGSPFSCLLIGGLPFSCACIEIYFLMGALWLQQYYYLMGYLLIVTLLIGVTSALMSVIMCYLRMSGEDHRWWWKSFTDTATIGVWLFGYSIWFLIFRMNMVGFLPVIVYLTYMSMISVAVGLYTGAVSFLATFCFTRTIYNAVKLD